MITEIQFLAIHCDYHVNSGRIEERGPAIQKVSMSVCLELCQSLAAGTYAEFTKPNTIEMNKVTTVGPRYLGLRLQANEALAAATPMLRSANEIDLWAPMCCLRACLAALVKQLQSGEFT